MSGLDQSRIYLLISGAAGLLLMTLGLIWMAAVLTRRSADQQRLIDAAWEATRQRLGLAASFPSIYERALDGQYRGRRLSIYGKRGKGQNGGYTHVAVVAGFQADIFLEAIAYRTIGITYRAAGDAEVDRRYFFRSQPDALLGRVLAAASVRQLLLESEVRWLRATPYEIRCGVRGIESDPARLARMVDLVSAAADAVGREVAAGIAGGPPLAEESYLAYGAKTYSGTAARLMVAGLVSVIIGCIAGIMVVARMVSDWL